MSRELHETLAKHLGGILEENPPLAALLTPRTTLSAEDVVVNLNHWLSPHVDVLSVTIGAPDPRAQLVVVTLNDSRLEPLPFVIDLFSAQLIVGQNQREPFTAESVWRDLALNMMSRVEEAAT